MRTVAIAALLPALFATPANAQSQKDICILLAPPMIQSSDAMADLAKNIDRLDFAPILPRISGELRTEYMALADRQRELKPVLAAYLAQLERAAIETRRCAR